MAVVLNARRAVAITQQERVIDEVVGIPGVGIPDPLDKAEAARPDAGGAGERGLVAAAVIDLLSDQVPVRVVPGERVLKAAKRR